MAKITGLSDSDFDSVGLGSASSLPKPLQAPALTADGKPEIVYIGAEYCPYCATERWPMVVALSRFGTFKNLGITHSSTSDVYPGTQTFSFHGATYTSNYITFNGVETQSNVASGSSYANLDTPTADEQALLTKYDAVPYVSADAAGSIPFIDFGGQYLISGSTYSPTVLQGLSQDQIASDLKDTSSPVYKGVMGTANTIIATICRITNNQPSDICQVEQSNGLISKLGG
jgi:thiol-disulfide isomerase/thioredoxin